MNDSGNVIATNHIVIVGIGGGGCNTIDNIASQWTDAPAIMAINTDAQALNAVHCATRLQIGQRITRNMGTGGESKVGRLAATEDYEAIQKLFQGLDLVFLVTALGGGTGTGAAPVIARAAQEAGAMVIAFATLPFSFEGDRRMSQAKQGLIELQDQTDVLITIPNQSLFAAAGANATAEEAFRQADHVLGMGIFAIWKLLTQRNIINLDFATLRMVARCSSGGSLFSYGEGKGPDKAAHAIQAALHGPLLENGEALAESQSLLVSILGGPDMSIREVETVMTAIKAAAHADAHIHMGTAVDDAWRDAMSVTIVASKYWREDIEPEEKVTDEPAPEPDATAPAQPVRKRKRKESATQPQLILEGISKGLFKDVQPTIINGEDMDVPTFIRRRVNIEK